MYMIIFKCLKIKPRIVQISPRITRKVSQLTPFYGIFPKVIVKTASVGT